MNMKNVHLNKIITNILVTLVFILLFSNILFYKKVEELEENNDYVFNMSRLITGAAHSSLKEILTSKFSDFLPSKVDYLMEQFEQIESSIGTKYGMDNYVAIKYANDNIVMLKVVQNEEGKFFIEEIFLLDKDIYDRLKYKRE